MATFFTIPYNGLRLIGWNEANRVRPPTMGLGRMGQNGFKYMEDEAGEYVVLQPDWDVDAARFSVRNGSWSHRTNPSRITVGTRCYLLCNIEYHRKRSEIFNGFEFVALGPPVKESDLSFYKRNQVLPKTPQHMRV